MMKKQGEQEPIKIGVPLRRTRRPNGGLCPISLDFIFAVYGPGLVSQDNVVERMGQTYRVMNGPSYGLRTHDMPTYAFK